MPLLAFGVNHHTAPVAFRERVCFAPEQLPEALRSLVTCRGVKEAAILSTCNRTDLYCGVDGDSGEAAVAWFRESHALTPKETKRYIYVHQAQHAVRHVMRVASGLDSLIIGEPQILGQIKDAYATARACGTVGHVLGKLFQTTFSVAKRVRTDTAIGSSPVSVAFAAVTLAKQIFGDLVDHTALLIGAGETIELAARHLKAIGLGRLVIANRTLENAHRLATEFDGYAIALNEITAHLAEADVLFSSTGADQVIVSREEVATAIKKRKRRPMFIVDMAVPRDIDPAAAELEDVYLYAVDDLGEVIQQNLRSRQDAARQAEEIIDTQVSHFMGWLGTLDVVSTIRAYRSGAERVRDEMARRAKRLIAAGIAPDEVAELLAHQLTNKLLHTPTVALRQAGYERRSDLVEAAQVLFDLPEPSAHGEADEPPRQTSKKP